MNGILADTACPLCNSANPVTPSFIGRYVTCRTCGSKYWVYVPPLEAHQPEVLQEPVVPRSASGVVELRQESLLVLIHEDLRALRRTIAMAAVVFALACVAVVIGLVMT